MPVYRFVGQPCEAATVKAFMAEVSAVCPAEYPVASCSSSLNSNFEETIQLRTILHLFQCLPFCLTDRKPYKGERDRCRYRVESVSAGETDRFQQR